MYCKSRTESSVACGLVGVVIQLKVRLLDAAEDEEKLLSAEDKDFVLSEANEDFEPM